MRIILEGDPQQAGGLVGWAKQKALLLPQTADQLYRVTDGSLIRIQRLKGNTVIYIHAGTALGYQFAVPFDYRNYPSDRRLKQSFIKYTAGVPSSPTIAGVAYETPELDSEGEPTGDLLTLGPTAYGTATVGGTAFMNLWWGEDKTYVAVSTPNGRYNTGFKWTMDQWGDPTLLFTTKPVIRQGKSKPFQVSEPWVDQFAIAGAYVLGDDGNKHLMFVTWDFDNSDGATLDVVFRQPDGTFLLYEESLPAWVTATVGTQQAPGYFCVNRQGTKMAATLASYRTEDVSGSFFGRRAITGVAEWDIVALVDPDTGVVSPDLSLVFDEVDTNDYIHYIAADYRWEEDGSDQLVVVKLRPYLDAFTAEETVSGYGVQYRMIAVFADWHEYVSGVEQAAYRSKQVFDGPFRMKIYDDPGGANTLEYDGFSASFAFQEDPHPWSDEVPGLGPAVDDMLAVHQANNGYLWKIGQIHALDLRADAYVISFSACQTANILSIFETTEIQRQVEYRAFSQSGTEVLTDLWDNGGTFLGSIGTAPTSFSGGPGYAALTTGHPDHGVDGLIMGGGGETSISLFSVYNAIWAPNAYLDVLRSDFIAIHPNKHWSAYAQMPVSQIYRSSGDDYQNGRIGDESNRRLFDTIRVFDGTATYTESSHLALIQQLWGATEPVDGVVEVPVDGYLAAATAGIWAV
jgi:hypothetical protein